MKNIMVIGTVLVLALAAATQARESDRDAHTLLRAAQVRETIQGDTEGAIELYKQAIAAAGDDRPVAARAWLGLGHAYGRVGSSQARAAFARVVRDFQDQPEAVRAANVRLAALRPARRTTQGDTARRVSSFTGGTSTTLGSISADGRFVVDNDTLHLVLRDLASGTARRIVEGTTSAFGNRPVASGDFRHIAYQWIETGGQAQRRSVRLSSLDGSSAPRTLRTLTGASAALSLEPVSWSADGTSVLALTRTGDGDSSVTSLDWISVADGTIRPIKTFTGSVPQSIRLSPDGQFLAYSRTLGGAQHAAESRIYVLDADGRVEAEVARMAGTNTHPAWAPDGSRVLFLSDRSGLMSLWSVTIRDGRAAAEPSLLKSEFHARPLGVTSSGALYFARDSDKGPSVFLSERSGTGLAITHAVAGFGAAWSHDGQRLAFIKRSTRGDRADIVVRAVESGEERVFGGEVGVDLVMPRWYPDDRQLLVVAGGIHLVLDTVTGTFTPVLSPTPPDSQRSATGALSPDGQTLYLSVRGRAGDPWNHLVAIDIANGQERVVATVPTMSPDAQPGLAVSPDGRALAILAMTDTFGQATLATVGVDGRDYRVVHGSVPAYRTGDLVRWTSEGRDIVYVESEPTGTWRVMRVPASGGTPQVEGSSTSAFTTPVPTPMGKLITVASIDVSPDGSQLVLSGGTLPVVELWVIDDISMLPGESH